MKSYQVKVSVLLEPVGSPMVNVSCGGQSKTLRLFTTASWVDFEFTQTVGDAQLIVEMFNKEPNDSTTAVIVKSVKLNGIEHIQHTFKGIYYPIDKDPVQDTYIAWNGQWILNFSVPVYTWMHQVQGLGWIYD